MWRCDDGRWVITRSRTLSPRISLSLSQFSDPTHTPRSPRVATSRMYNTAFARVRY